MGTRGHMYDAVKDAELRITGKKFCSNCRRQAGVEGGSTITRNKRTRWRCKSCTENAKKLGV
tara:strand:+ start:6020 stop:6205 length:186 start_codon:yes stop_codon:yes gene_type:complete